MQHPYLSLFPIMQYPFIFFPDYATSILALFLIMQYPFYLYSQLCNFHFIFIPDYATSILS